MAAQTLPAAPNISDCLPAGSMFVEMPIDHLESQHGSRKKLWF